MKCNTFKFSSYDCKHRFLLWDKRMCQVLINVYFFVDDDLTLCMKTCWNAVARQFLIHSQHHDIYPVVGSWTKMFTSQRLAFVLYLGILMLSRNFELNDIQKIVILNKWWCFFKLPERPEQSGSPILSSEFHRTSLIITYSKGFSCRKQSIFFKLSMRAGMPKHYLL